MVALTPEAQETVEIFKALSRAHKQPPTLFLLSKEFYELEGRPPPTPGFANVEQLLRASNEFILRQNGRDLIVSAKITENTAHIAQMIAAHRNPKKKGKSNRGGFRFGRVAPPPGVPNYNASRQYSRPTNNNRNMSRGGGRGGYNQGFNKPRPMNTFNGNSRIATQRNYTVTGLKLVSPDRGDRTDRKDRNDTNNNIHALQPISPIKPKQSLTKTTLSPEFIKKTPSAMKGDLPSQRAIVIQPRSSSPPPPQSKSSPAKNLKLKIEPFVPYEPIPIVTPPALMKPSVQDRLKKYPKVEPENGFIDKLCATVEEKLRIEIPKGWWDSNQVTQVSPIERLELYCTISGLQPPNYKFLPVRIERSSKWCSLVTVGDMTFSTYPEDFPTTDEAKMFVAARACEQLKLKLANDEKPQFPEFSGTKEKLLVTLYETLSKHPSGVFMRKIPDLMQCEAGVTISSDYVSLISDHAPTYFRLESDTATGDELVFVEKIEGLPELCTGSDTSSLSGDGTNGLPPPLNLPAWDSNEWFAHVVTVNNSTSIIVKLVGPDYHDKVLELYAAIEKAELKKIEGVPVVGHYYIATVGGFFNRVTVDQVNEDEQLAECTCIDTAEEILVNWCNIHECDLNFLQLPAQAFQTSMYGLEVFSKSERTTHLLQTRLEGKVFVCEPKMSQEVYENDGRELLPMIFFDTSTDDDINMNETLIEEVKNLLQPPRLSPNTTPVIVTGITDNGEIAVQLQVNEMELINYTIATLLETRDLNEYQGLYDDTVQDGLYLVYDDGDQTWYRAALVDLIDSEKIKFNLIDLGLDRAIHKNSIFRLKDMYMGANVYPAQAIRVKLHDVPAMTVEVIRLLRGMLTNQKTAFVKIQGHDWNTPEVMLCFYNSANETITCVNDALKKQCNGHTVDLESTKSANSELVRSPSSVESFNDECGPIPVVSLPNAGDYFEIRVVVAESPKCFFVQPSSSAKLFAKLTTDLQRYCSIARQLVSEDILLEHEYAAMRKDDRSWCRVVVLKKFDGSDLISVYYCDYGKIDVISLCNFRKLPNEFRILPAQAIQAKLYGVKPKQGDNYSHEVAAQFIKLVQDKLLQSILRGVEQIPKNTFLQKRIVSLELFDATTKSDADVFIAKKLIEENLVAPAN